MKKFSHENPSPEFIALLQARDRGAFEILYDRYSAAIYGLVRKIVIDEELAQDTLQEAFIRIWKKMHTYDPSRGRLFTWMLNLSRNLAIDKLRSKEVKNSRRTDSLTVAVAETRGPSSSMKIEHIGLRELVDALPPEQRQVIDLIYFQGYTQAETAEEMGIPLGTVKSRVRLVMKSLRRIVV